MEPTGKLLPVCVLKKIDCLLLGYLLLRGRGHHGLDHVCGVLPPELQSSEGYGPARNHSWRHGTW